MLKEGRRPPDMKKNVKKIAYTAILAYVPCLLILAIFPQANDVSGMSVYAMNLLFFFLYSFPLFCAFLEFCHAAVGFIDKNERAVFERILDTARVVLAVGILITFIDIRELLYISLVLSAILMALWLLSFVMTRKERKNADRMSVRAVCICAVSVIVAVIGVFYLVWEIIDSRNRPDPLEDGEYGDEMVDHSGYTASIKLIQYNWNGPGVSVKTIGACDITYSIIDALNNATETGETVKEISNDKVDESSKELPVDRGTLWVEADSKIYRIDPSFATVCRVDGHLGKGRVLNVSDQIKKKISDAWHYYPYDYYSGSYSSETGKIVLTHVYDAPSNVKVDIESICVANEHHSENSIIIELLSSVDQTLSVSLSSQQSDDNLAAGDFEEVTLKAGKKETLKLHFGGWKDFNYWIYVKAGNTKIEVMIDP